MIVISWVEYIQQSFRGYEYNIFLEFSLEQHISYHIRFLAHIVLALFDRYCAFGIVRVTYVTECCAW